MSGGALGGGRMVEDSSSVAGILLIKSLTFSSWYASVSDLRGNMGVESYVLSLYSVLIVSFSSTDFCLYIGVFFYRK